MSIKIYYTDPYLKKWETEIKDKFEKDGRIIVKLKETAFYPEGGGQPCDIGTIDGIKVLDVFEEGEDICHVLESIPENKIVKCCIDFDRRFDYMQQHTGEHLLAAVFAKLYNATNNSFHLGTDYVSIDVDLPEVTEKMIKDVEDLVNEYIQKDFPVSTYMVTKEEANKLPLRKESSVESNIRVVQIGEVDYSACCATHVLTTGQIGLIKIIKTEKSKGMTRIIFKCGRRALEDFQNKHDIIANLYKFLSVDENSVIERVEQQNENIKNLNKSFGVKKILAEYEVENLISTAESNIIIKSYEDKNFEEINNIAKSLENKEYIVVLSSLEDKQLLFAHNGDFNVKCGKTFKENLSLFNGKGGGNNKRAQASFKSVEDMKRFEAILTNLI